ncbi:hypothetical protein ACROYT_G019222 [Oculina patagonica]
MNQYGIPQKIVNIVRALYDGFECAFAEEEATSEWFELTTGVKQGCTMSGFLFLLIVDRVMRHTVKEKGTGLRWKFTSKLEDLDFADDVALISSTQRHMQLKTNRLVENAERTGLRNRCLRRIMKIKWQDKISNRELLEGANVEKLSEEVVLDKDANMDLYVLERSGRNGCKQNTLRAEVCAVSAVRCVFLKILLVIFHDGETQLRGSLIKYSNVFYSQRVCKHGGGWS